MKFVSRKSVHSCIDKVRSYKVFAFKRNVNFLKFAEYTCAWFAYNTCLVSFALFFRFQCSHSILVIVLFLSSREWIVCLHTLEFPFQLEQTTR